MVLQPYIYRTTMKIILKIVIDLFEFLGNIKLLKFEINVKAGKIMKCMNCGESVDSNDKFCMSCGSNLEEQKGK